MLVLTRKQNEKIRIGDSITITVLRMKGKAVRIGIEAPHEMNVIRGELCFDLEDECTDTSEAVATEAAVSVPPKSKPRTSAARNAIAQEATSHWPAVSGEQDSIARTTCTLPLATAPLRTMVEART